MFISFQLAKLNVLNIWYSKSALDLIIVCTNKEEEEEDILLRAYSGLD